MHSRSWALSIMSRYRDPSCRNKPTAQEVSEAQRILGGYGLANMVSGRSPKDDPSQVTTA